MKIITLLLGFISLVQLCNAQNEEKYSAMILTLDGEGVLIRDSKEINLELPQRYLESDQLKVNKGNASIMLFSGEEINISAVSDYTIPIEDTPKTSELSKMANTNKSGKSLLSQSGVAYQIRGTSAVFPGSSKVLFPKNIALTINYDNIKELNLSLKLIDSQTQKLVYQTSITESIVSLAEADVKTGKSYHWIISNTPSGKPEIGTIIIAKNKQLQELNIVDQPKSHYEYMNTISSYYNKHFYFEALQTINQAIDKYPSHKIYQILKKELLKE
ncbi:hypothetical protein [Carboxylicivirga sp. N1Y90]|uniref:hypothetical protein n=1 Tax=Carboxylicivirga fragile TaxID=3417571 RepID=UPI003D33B7D1|nr:hypothetical protein [Marinilabiliaceae bacterium N1Y90]